MVELKLWRTIKYFYHVRQLWHNPRSTLGARWDYIGIFSFFACYIYRIISDYLFY